MDIASLSAISGIENISKYADNSLQTEKSKGSGTASFDSLLNSAMNLVQQTEDYSNAAEVEEVKYAMGQSKCITAIYGSSKKHSSRSISFDYEYADLTDKGVEER